MPKSPPTTAELQADPYKRGTKVRLVDDIPGYPAGSEGKVAVANGFAWQRYWIRFADGESVGHIDHGSVVRAKDYERFLVQREREAVEAEKAAELAAAAAEAGGDDAGDSGGAAAGGGVTVNGVTVPQRLLDMSAAARTRLGA
ncbi:MAG: hypothetical protein R8F63_08905 [Acidimicrobiales bacterium]|nr:hypothetical protein [Acidimicrobiales bacterium]